MRWTIVLAGLSLLACSGGHAVSDAAPVAACRSGIPADIAQRPATWLGSCAGGVAEGLGVLRAGTREPYDFFLGRMANGRPVDGLLILRDRDWLAAHSFDGRGAIAPARDVTPRQFDALFASAAAAADSVARRMAAARNTSSAAYYRALAAKVRRAPPE